MRGKRPELYRSARSRRIIPARAGQTPTRAATTPATADHPRACGANVGVRQDITYKVGSSPRVRGKQWHVFEFRAEHRIIPARAGQTCHHGELAEPVTDHPRACGANHGGVVVYVQPPGSSPRVRGKPLAPAGHMAFARIIPARAGQTFQRSKTWQPTPDHPRACGANPFSGLAVALIAGSSPRVRGKPRFGRAESVVLRIIPARAGQTRCLYFCFFCCSDHPRACGANLELATSADVNAGSSPRVRGKLKQKQKTIICARIIPARAGQTVHWSAIASKSSDHPRACGANKYVPLDMKPADGSSPRVRGKPPALVDKSGGLRIIPARAGQTLSSTPILSACTDHPRACGANLCSGLVGARHAGSSPRVRGKRVQKDRA